MSKINQPFSFKYEKNGLELTVKGIGYFHPSAPRLDIEDRYDFDLEYLEGVTPLEVLQYSINIEDINEAALRHVAMMFDSEKQSPVEDDLFKQACRAAYSPYMSKERLDKMLES